MYELGIKSNKHIRPMKTTKQILYHNKIEYFFFNEI